MSNLPPKFKEIFERYGVLPKPILFNTEMVRANLNDSKKQTRRVVPKHLTIIKIEYHSVTFKFNGFSTPNTLGIDEFIGDFAKYKIGETIWVREPARVVNVHGTVVDVEFVSDETKVSIKIPKRFYKAQAGCSIINYSKWISACKNVPNGCIREMARIFLKITGVRVERLQDITIEDILNEGCDLDCFSGGQMAEIRILRKATLGNLEIEKFMLDWWINLWNKTAPKGYKWDDNPYVFVYEFEKIAKFDTINKRG